MIDWSRVKGMLLDVDGTLALTDDLHFEVFRDVLVTLGYDNGTPITREFFNSDISGGFNADLALKLFPHWNREQCEKFGDDKEALWRSKAATSIQAVSGLLDFSKIVGDLPRCAVTNACRANAELIISGIGLQDWIGTNLVIGEECPLAKPFPDPYLCGAKVLGLKASECLAVEDSMTGIQSALAAGCGIVIGITTNLSKEQLKLAGATVVVSDWNELKNSFEVYDQ